MPYPRNIVVRNRKRSTASSSEKSKLLGRLSCFGCLGGDSIGSDEETHSESGDSIVPRPEWVSKVETPNTFKPPALKRQKRMRKQLIERYRAEEARDLDQSVTSWPLDGVAPSRKASKAPGSRSRVVHNLFDMRNLPHPPSIVD